MSLHVHPPPLCVAHTLIPVVGHLHIHAYIITMTTSHMGHLTHGPPHTWATPCTFYSKV